MNDRFRDLSCGAEPRLLWLRASLSSCCNCIGCSPNDRKVRIAGTRAGRVEGSVWVGNPWQRGQDCLALVPDRMQKSGGSSRVRMAFDTRSRGDLRTRTSDRHPNGPRQTGPGDHASATARGSGRDGRRRTWAAGRAERAGSGRTEGTTRRGPALARDGPCALWLSDPIGIC